ncbi:MAG: glutaminyl-peptide cyclotransferase [Acidobacteria bacterium]|nr:glutaminyl-peptide cyclotransferase [Acidobacteriota bacterium]
MNRQVIARTLVGTVASFGIVFLGIVWGAGSGAAPAARFPQQAGAPIQSFTVVQSFPHDPSAFTQGLVYADGEFLESTGLNGQSSLRRVEIATGKVLQRRAVDSQYFAEGLALVGDVLVQLTWQHNIGFVYDRKTFAPKGTFKYPTEGWGITYDAKGGLVMSDGSAQLFFLNPETYAVTKTINVSDAGRPIRDLNELEWIEGEIWANVWQTDRIARINPATGNVNAWVDLSLLWPLSRRMPPADVLNGIAYDPSTKRIFVTGKQWPRVYEIRTK